MQSRTVLIADDSGVTRRAVRRIIDSCEKELHIVEAKDGIECAQSMARHKVDVAFVDYHMPGCNGLEVLEIAHKAGLHCLVVLMSTRIDEDFLERAKKYRAYEFLEKPFDRDDVQRVLDYQQAMRKPHSLLVVDDSKTVRKVAFKVTKESHFSLSMSEASSGKQALTLARSLTPSIIFVDQNMPDLNGLETSIMLRQICPKARIVLMSSDHSPELIEKAKQAGLCGFIKKPFDAGDLDRTLHQLMGMSLPVLGSMSEVFTKPSDLEGDDVKDVEATQTAEEEKDEPTESYLI